MWDYAELSKTAKVFGGPEKLIKAAVKKGRYQMIPVALIVGGIASLVTWGIMKSKKKAEEELEKAKEEFNKNIIEDEPMVESGEAKEFDL